MQDTDPNPEYNSEDGTAFYDNCDVARGVGEEEWILGRTTIDHQGSAHDFMISPCWAELTAIGITGRPDQRGIVSGD